MSNAAIWAIQPAATATISPTLSSAWSIARASTTAAICDSGASIPTLISLSACL